MGSSRVFFSSTVQYFVMRSTAPLPNGSRSAPSVSFSMSLMKLPAMEYPTNSAMAVMKEAMVERARMATAKMMAAAKRVLGSPITRKACTCGASRLGPTRSGSSHGIQLPRTIPNVTPSRGSVATKVLPRNFPIR